MCARACTQSWVAHLLSSTAMNSVNAQIAEVNKNVRDMIRMNTAPRPHEREGEDEEATQNI